MKYYVLDSRSVSGNSAVWWRPDGAGYTCDLGDAGLYEDSWMPPRKTDIMVPQELAERLAARHVNLDRLRTALRRGDKR